MVVVTCPCDSLALAALCISQSRVSAATGAAPIWSCPSAGCWEPARGTSKSPQATEERARGGASSALRPGEAGSHTTRTEHMVEAGLLVGRGRLERGDWDPLMWAPALVPDPENPS